MDQRRGDDRDDRQRLALTLRDRPQPAAYGFPVKLRVPTKLGFKNPKHIVFIEVTNVYPGGFWEDYGYTGA